jgi:hypothetical protein
MAARVASAAIPVEARGRPVGAPWAIVLPVIAPVQALHDPDLARHDRVDHRRVRRAHPVLAIVGHWGLGLVSRIGQRLGHVRVEPRPVLADQEWETQGRLGLRRSGLMSPSAQPMVLMVAQPDAQRGGRTPCRSLSSGR